MAKLCVTIFGIAESASGWSSKASSKGPPRLNNFMERRMSASNLLLGDCSGGVVCHCEICYPTIAQSRRLRPPYSDGNGSATSKMTLIKRSMPEGRFFGTNLLPKARHYGKSESPAWPCMPHATISDMVCPKSWPCEVAAVRRKLC